MSSQLKNALQEYSVSTWCTATERPFVAIFFELLTAKNELCFDRAPGGHITSSAWILNFEGTHALLTHHRKLNKWLQLGGHNDGDNDCARTALREAHEESGIERLAFVMPNIFDIDIHSLPNACAYHYDIRYILRAPKGAQYLISEESHDLAWIPLDQIDVYTSEPSVLRMQEKTKHITMI